MAKTLVDMTEDNIGKSIFLHLSDVWYRWESVKLSCDMVRVMYESANLTSYRVWPHCVWGLRVVSSCRANFAIILLCHWLLNKVNIVLEFKLQGAIFNQLKKESTTFRWLDLSFIKSPTEKEEPNVLGFSKNICLF